MLRWLALAVVGLTACKPPPGVLVEVDATGGVSRDQSRLRVLVRREDGVMTQNDYDVTGRKLPQSVFVASSDGTAGSVDVTAQALAGEQVVAHASGRGQLSRDRGVKLLLWLSPADGGTGGGAADGGGAGGGDGAGGGAGGTAGGGGGSGGSGPETSCGDGLDNDSDGDIDCADADCSARICDGGTTHFIPRCCGSQCVDTAFDGQNCGACGVVCPNRYCFLGGGAIPTGLCDCSDAGCPLMQACLGPGQVKTCSCYPLDSARCAPGSTCQRVGAIDAGFDLCIAP